MPSIWIVSEDASARETLLWTLAALGDVSSFPPESARFQHAPAPDLLVVAPLPESGRMPALERLLEFVRGVARVRAAPPPALYVEPEGGEPSAALAMRLFDDRRVRACPFPLDPDRVELEARALLAAEVSPASLRAREQRAWISEEVELYYAGLELPALRRAIDPRNAAWPVLLVGEPGTGRGLLARYIHALAEPPRERFVSLSGASLVGGELDARLGELTRGVRSTVYLAELERAEQALQEELGSLLEAGGWLGVESLRWIASAQRGAPVAARLRRLPWLRVELPPLRAREDFDELARGIARSLARRAGREIELAPDALAALHPYGWPRNLAELRERLAAAIARTRAGALSADDLALPVRRAEVAREAPEAATEPEPTTRPTAEAPVAAPETVAAPEPGAAPEPLAAAAPETPAAAVAPAGASAAVEAADELGLAEVVAPLAQEIRRPMLAIRTYAASVDRGGPDAALRRELGTLVDQDLGRVEQALTCVEQYASFGPPARRPLDLAALIGAELERRRALISSRKLVILEELDRHAPPAIADEQQLAFAIGALLDRALRMVPPGGDLYVGSFHHATSGAEPGRQRLLIRFHSPEDVLVPPAGIPGSSTPLEVVIAHALIERMGGAFAVDASGAQDNVILIDLPA